MLALNVWIMGIVKKIKKDGVERCPTNPNFLENKS
jgi:hypothetical protein